MTWFSALLTKWLANAMPTLAIPGTVHQVIIFIDNPAPTSTSPTFEGYVTIVDGGAATGGPSNGVATQDASFFECKCADLDGCAN